MQGQASGSESTTGNGAAGGGADESRQDTNYTKAIAVWQTVLAEIILLAGAILVVSFFSDTFDYGDDVINFFLDHSTTNRRWKPYAAYFATVAIFLVLYFFDFSYWKTTLGVAVRRIAVAAMLVCAAGAGLLSLKYLPFVPLAVFMMLIPLTALFLRSTLFRHNHPGEVACVMGFNFITSAIVVIVIWLCWLAGAWTTEHNHWFENREDFIAKARCAEGGWVGYHTVVEDQQLCLAAFLLWMSPLLLFGVLLFLGAFLIVLARTFSHGSGSATTRFAAKLMTYLLAISFVGMYSAASIAGGGIQFSNAAFAIFGVFLLGMFLMVGSTIGWNSLRTKISEQPIVQRAYNLGSPYIDVMHACFLLGCPLYVLFLGFSFLNQTCRRAFNCNSTCCKTLTPTERPMRLTSVAQKCNQAIVRWEWTKALVWTNILCFAMWALKYGSIVTNIFLNWLIAQLTTDALHPGVVTVIFVFIGLAMFLIPIVPGPAVYLASGILMVPVYEQAFGGRTAGGACNATAALDLNATLPGLANATLAGGGGGGGGGGEVSASAFWLACLGANAISYCLKLVAHVLQQKCIGEVLGSRVSIRAMVSPNTKLMKSIRYLLSQPGVTAPKVCVMCGGPDWPTSVICGFLRLECCNLVLGLTPMFLMTVPTTLAGAFFNPPYESYANLQSFLFLIVILVQLVLGVGLFHYVGRAQADHGDEINRIPDDEAVKQLDQKSELTNALHGEVTRWAGRDMPTWVRVALISGTVMLQLTFYALVLYPSLLFQPFGLTDCRDELGKSPYDMPFGPVGISPAGALALLFLVLSMVTFWLYSHWAKGAVAARIAGGDISVEDGRGAGREAGEGASAATATKPAAPATTCSSSKVSDVLVKHDPAKSNLFGRGCAR